MTHDDPVPAPPRDFVSPLPRLKIGSTFTTRRGIRIRVREAVVIVARSGGESPSVWVERVREGRTAELFMTVGMLANVTRGATHQPGTGARIDWTQTPRCTQVSVPGSSDPPRNPQGLGSFASSIWNTRDR